MDISIQVNQRAEAQETKAQETRVIKNSKTTLFLDLENTEAQDMTKDGKTKAEWCTAGENRIQDQKEQCKDDKHCDEEANPPSQADRNDLSLQNTCLRIQFPSNGTQTDPDLPDPSDLSDAPESGSPYLFSCAQKLQVLDISSYRQRDAGSASQAINPTVLQRNTRKLKVGLIAPAKEEVSCALASEHTSEPIKNMEDIIRVSKYLIGQQRYRDNMLFIVGINFGLRVSDLRMLRFSNLINGNLTFKNCFPVFEQKTRNTRKHKRNRYITINDAVMDAVTLYLENTSSVSLSDYMFRSESNHGSANNEPIHRCTVDRILKGIAKDLNLNIQMSTHTLRKTFAYHQMLMSNNDPRKLLLLQKMMGHSSAAQTLDYIGITNEEIQEAYRKLNLGSTTYNYLIDSEIDENENAAG